MGEIINSHIPKVESMASISQILMLVSIVCGVVIFYIQYKMFIVGKVTFRPVAQGLIALLIAVCMFIGLTLLLQ